jgi:hypothetical protein
MAVDLGTFRPIAFSRAKGHTWVASDMTTPGWQHALAQLETAF